MAAENVQSDSTRDFHLLATVIVLKKKVPYKVSFFLFFQIKFIEIILHCVSNPIVHSLFVTD